MNTNKSIALGLVLVALGMTSCRTSQSRVADDDAGIKPYSTNLSVEQQRQILAQVQTLRAMIPEGRYSGKTDSGEECEVKSQFEDYTFYLDMTHPATNWEKDRLQYIWGVSTFDTNFFGVKYPYNSARFEIDPSTGQFDSSYKIPDGMGTFSIVISVKPMGDKTRLEMTSARGMMTMFSSTYECTISAEDRRPVSEE